MDEATATPIGTTEVLRRVEQPGRHPRIAFVHPPPGWPQHCSITRTSDGAPYWPPIAAWPDGRPIAQWSRLAAGRSDDLSPANP